MRLMIMALLIGGAVPAAAAQTATPPPPLASGAQCQACNQIAERLAAFRSDLESLRQKRQQQYDEEARDVGFDIIINELDRNAESRRLTKDPVRLKELDAQRQDLIKASLDLRGKYQAAQAQTQAAIDLLRGLIVDLELELAECNKESCAPPPATGTTDTTGGTTGAPTHTGTTACAPCAKAAEDAANKQAELDAAKATLDNITTNERLLNTALKAAQAAGNIQRQQDIQGQIDRLGQAKARAQTNVDAKAAELAPLLKALDDCTKECKPSETSLFQGPWPYVIGGGGAVALLAGRGGDSPTVIASTPVAPQQPTATTPAPPQNPTPPPPPAPDAIDLRMGTYVVQSCLCELDQGGLDRFLHLCEMVRQFRLTRTGTNTANIDGDAPLIRSDFIIDANGQAIDASARGLVGTSSATLHYSGTFGSGGSITVFLNYEVANTNTRYRVTAARQ